MGDWLDFYSNLRRVVRLAARAGVHSDTLTIQPTDKEQTI